MRYGVIFPQTEIGTDPAAIRDYAQAAEELGYSHILAYDHVLGADRNRPGGWDGPYDSATLFHEPLVLFAFLAATTSRIELATGVLILPQRQAVLVAKQAAEVDVLSGGRLRLGVGTGWNAVEYEGLNEDFHTRGRRQEEQIEIMRLLWEHDIVDYAGRWHTVNRAGINPRPHRRIPIWFGGWDERVMHRAARLGDGWTLNRAPDDATRAAIARIREHVHEAGRDPAAFGIEALVPYAAGPGKWATHIERWQAAGATHLAVNTMNAGLSSPRDHIEAIRQYRQALPH